MQGCPTRQRCALPVLYSTMNQLLVYLLLALALALPVFGALALRVFGPRLTQTQYYGAAAGLFGVVLLSVAVLARGDIPSLQLGGLSVLLPVTSPGDVAPQVPAAALPTEIVPAEVTPATNAPSAVPPTAAAGDQAIAEATLAATALATATIPPTATTAPTAVPTAPPTATPAPTELPTAAPAPAGPRKYTVQTGDTLRSIAEKFNVSVKAIIDANKLTAAEADSLRVGQELIIP